MLLDRWWHVGEHRGVAWPGDCEEIWEFGDAETQIALRAFLLERLSTGAADVGLQQRTRHRIAAGGRRRSLRLRIPALPPNAGLP